MIGEQLNGQRQTPGKLDLDRDMLESVAPGHRTINPPRLGAQLVASSNQGCDSGACANRTVSVKALTHPNYLHRTPVAKPLAQAANACIQTACSVPNESLNRAPPNQDDVVIGEGLTKLGARYDVDVALAPCGIPHVPVHGDGTHLRVVVREMHEQLADARLQILDDVEVELLPPRRLHVIPSCEKIASGNG